MKHLQIEPMDGIASQSCLMILDFSETPPETPSSQNIQKFFEACEKTGKNPRDPSHGQEFNNQMLEKTNSRYLISRYAEDRIAMLAGSSIADVGRTLHMGIDIFCKDLESVYAPADVEIVAAGNEPENHSFGYYIIMKAIDMPELPYIFYGHLDKALPAIGQRFKAGECIGSIGDYEPNHPNGGWSRHLHLQMLSELPAENSAPLGYASKANFSRAATQYPSPVAYFRCLDETHNAL